MWQTKYASVAPRNLGLGFDFKAISSLGVRNPCSDRKYHTGLDMYMEPLKKWAQHISDWNFTISISLYFIPSYDEGPIFANLYWKAVQGLNHTYVVKNTSSEIINCLYFILSKPFWPLEAIKLDFIYINHLIKAKSSLNFNMRTIQKLVSVG